MIAYAFSILILVVSIALSMPSWNQKYDSNDMEIIASSFVRYQNAVTKYYEDNPGTTGSIADASLNLMPGYVPLGTWQNRISGGILYVYAADGQDMVAPAIVEMKFSKRVGVNTSGRLVSPKYGDLGVNLPAFISEGSIVTICE